jgi:Mn-dependent DtxR family transcriptional regulator
MFVVAASNWVMEELTRLYLTNDPLAAQALIENLLVKDIPIIEQIDGDSLVLSPGLSARVQLEILLYQHHPERCTARDLISWIRHSEHNIRVTLSKLKSMNLAHEADAGWKLTESGVREAEAEIRKILSAPGRARKRYRVKAKGVSSGKK